MKSQSTASLRQELSSVGADEAESSRLVAIAASLRDLKAVKSRRNRWQALAPHGATAFVGLAIGAALVMFSQTSLPGNWLYPVKKVSEHVAVSVDPNYRGVVMMRRAQEVQQLVAKRANSHQVLATLADYRSQAAAYKSSSTNYSVFEFCKANLQQAEAGAPAPERQAISSTLASLNDV